MKPQTTIVGVIDGIEPLEKVTIMNIAVEKRGKKGERETAIYPVKWFEGRAEKYGQPGLRGREVVVHASVSSRKWETKYYLDLLGEECGFISRTKAQAPQAAQPPISGVGRPLPPLPDILPPPDDDEKPPF